ncbi:MAG: SRPBCC family protein [Bifidobacteriaceae bacterium]|jgi:hypothetical protein|nr:SRPBCC family protein [Bifidobacteriaceae bacterium]
MKLEMNGKALAAAVVAAPVATVLGLNQYAKRLVATPEEQEKAYPGDDLLGEQSVSGGALAIDVDAPPEKIWPLLLQLGQDKAGFYSFSRFERMAHFVIHNTYEPQERWQHLQVGDWVFYGAQGVGHQIALMEPNRYLVGVSDTRNPPAREGAIAWCPPGLDMYAWTWGFFMEPRPGGGTRLISHTRVALSPAEAMPLQAKAVVGGWGWSSGVMTTRMLQVIKKCAEGRRSGLLYALYDGYARFWDRIWGAHLPR